VVTGATKREIAAALSVTENTVKVYLHNAIDKLHLQNRIQATVYAIHRSLMNDVEPSK